MWYNDKEYAKRRQLTEENVLKYIILAYTELPQDALGVSLVPTMRGALAKMPEFTESRRLTELAYASELAAVLTESDEQTVCVDATGESATRSDIGYLAVAPILEAFEKKGMPVSVITVCATDSSYAYRLFCGRDVSLPEKADVADIEALIAMVEDARTALQAVPSAEEAAKESSVAPAVENAPRGKHKAAASIFDWYELFAYAIAAVIVVMSFFVRHSPVEGSSMYPTLVGGSSVDTETTLAKGYDTLLISALYSLDYGDIVIIQEPSQPTEPIVKRVIAMGGDTIKINFSNGDVWLNGEKLEEDYIRRSNVTIPSERLEPDENNCWEGTVPEGQIFVLGDNREVSKDSRYFGFIDERYIIGKAILRIAPLSKFGTID